MHYVKQFNINGVATKQVACIELQGKPNAATEGQVGVLGVDVTSPTHDVYKCVAVNGSIYTWELLSSGMSMISSSVIGEGADISFAYESLLKPDHYVVKVGDLILDRGGYLYQVSAIGSTACDGTYTGVHFGVDGLYGIGRYLVIKDGQLQLVSENGNVLSSVSYIRADGSTLRRDASTGTASVIGVNTINNTLLRFFVGTQEEYNNLADSQKTNLFALITDDKAKEEFWNAINGLGDGLADGSIVPLKAGEATTIKKYLHNVQCKTKETSTQYAASLSFQIVTDSSSEMTYDNIRSVLLGKEFTTKDKALPCSGYFYTSASNSFFVVNGLYAGDAPYMCAHGLDGSHQYPSLNGVQYEVSSDVVIPL